MNTLSRLRTSTDAPKGSQMNAKPRGSVVDLFCGAGGLSHGFKLEGYDIAAGFDTDQKCRYPFEVNNDAPFFSEDVSKLKGEVVRDHFKPSEPKILVGCAPCQPFSKYSQGREDGRWQLLEDFARLICESDPDIVSMENVPRLCKFKDSAVFDQFVRTLRNNDYFVDWTVAYCPDFGIPQSRSRLVLIASKYGPPGVPKPTHTRENYQTVREAIGSLPKISAGQALEDDPLHRCSSLSKDNLKRIKASQPGGSWRDWSEELVTECHRKESGKGYSSVYGRMSWDAPGPTMTTQFFGFGNGRFGHPEQDRAISLREGALLQSFPESYKFVPDNETIHVKTVGRLIGNAVPVDLGRAIARQIRAHLEEYDA